MIGRKYGCAILIVLGGCSLFEDPKIRYVDKLELKPAADTRDYIHGVATVETINSGEYLGSVLTTNDPVHVVGDRVKLASEGVEVHYGTDVKDSITSSAKQDDELQYIDKAFAEKSIATMNKLSDSKSEKNANYYENKSSGK